VRGNQPGRERPGLGNGATAPAREAAMPEGAGARWHRINGDARPANRLNGSREGDHREGVKHQSPHSPPGARAPVIGRAGPSRGLGLRRSRRVGEPGRCTGRPLQARILDHKKCLATRRHFPDVRLRSHWVAQIETGEGANGTDSATANGAKSRARAARGCQRGDSDRLEPWCWRAAQLVVRGGLLQSDVADRHGGRRRACIRWYRLWRKEETVASQARRAGLREYDDRSPS
jgi:hypothetical protein